MSNFDSISERIVSSLLREDEAADFLSDFSKKSENGLGPIPAEHEPHILRAVRLYGHGGRSYYLILWDTGARGEYGKPHLGYRFVLSDGTVLWQGTNYQPSLVHGRSLGDDEMMAELISMMTDNPETSGGGFEGWTQSQLEFAGSEEGQFLNSVYGEYADHGDEARFEDLPGYERQQEPE